MLEEFQEIYDFWISQKDNYDYNVYTSRIQNNINSAKNVDELITALDTTNYSYSYRVDLQKIFTQIAIDYPETKERIDKIIFKREIAKIISPDYYGDNKDIDKIQKLDNVDEIIDVLSKMSSRNKTKALAYIKEQRPDKAETIDLVLPKLLVLQNVSDWNEEEKIVTAAEKINQKIMNSANYNEKSSEKVRHSHSAKNNKQYE